MLTAPFNVQSPVPRFRTTSPGELLWLSLRDLYGSKSNEFPAAAFFDLTAWAEPSGAMSHFFADLVISLAVYKILKAGKRIEKEEDLFGNALHTEAGEEIFQARIREYLVEFLGISFLDSGGLRVLPHLALLSLKVSRKDIEASSRTWTLSESRSLSVDGCIRCYCCGRLLLSSLGGSLKHIPLDHVWPRSLGGISTEENLLPICDDCNGAKTDRLSWSIYGIVQDYAAATQTGNADLMLSLALQRRAAVKLGETNYITLKEAFLILGPSEPLADVDSDETRSFFNLTSHNVSKLSSLW